MGVDDAALDEAQGRGARSITPQPRQPLTFPRARLNGRQHPAEGTHHMSAASFREYSGPAAQLYQEFFVPSIAAPASGRLLRVVDLKPGERVVDVACGTAYWTQFIAGRADQILGVDASIQTLSVAKHRQLSNVKLIVGDAYPPRTAAARSIS